MSKNNSQDISLKEKEIQRLINSNGKKEPIKGILSDEEILKYAGDSKAAALIRLKNGSNNTSDKWRLHKRNTIILYTILFFPAFILFIFSFNGDLIVVSSFIFILLILIDYPLYYLYIKDYNETKEVSKYSNEEKNIFDNKSTTSIENNNINSFNVYKSQINDLKSLYEVKEKIAKELIEKRFEPPQLTYDKFISSVNNCTELFDNQVYVSLNILNLATEHTSEMDYEIESRIKILK